MYRTLIVEDEYWMGHGLQKIVSRYCPDYQIVHIAKDGAEALDFLDKQPVDLVITDICMPEMDGIELIKQMKERKMNAALLIISGHSEFEYAKKAIHYGVKDYLLKPIRRHELVEALEKLKKEHWHGPSPIQTESIDHDALTGRGLIDLVLDRMHTAYMQDLSLSDIAREMEFNASYLSRLFKEHTGESFVKYLNQIRIREAKRILRQSSCSVFDVSAKVGFWDEKYFSRCFKREVGLSPTEYRSGKE